MSETNGDAAPASALHLVKTFIQTGDFEAVRVAERFLADAGFSVGIMQAHAPRGILFGDYSISKWRNMTPREVSRLDGKMVGGRAGPVNITIYHDARPEAREAFTKALEKIERMISHDGKTEHRS